MVRLASVLFILSTSVAAAEYRITRDHGGFVEDYKARYAKVRDSGERVVIDGACNEELLSYYPPPVKDWINRNGGLTPDMKRVENGPDLWAMISPCPEEF